MNPGERIAKLERLLVRVQKNAAAGRAKKGEPAAPALTPPPPSDGEAAPIPLVAVAPAQVPGDDEVTVVAAPVVVPATEPQMPATEVPSRISSIPPELAAEELSEDDLVEINSVPPPSVGVPPVVEEPPALEARPEAGAAAPGRDDLDFEDEEEERPPASSKRSKVPTSMDEALAAAAAQLGEEHEVPIKTPPPESGPQEAVPAPAALSPGAVPDVDELLEAELAQPGPRPEQLGETIELDEARGPALELNLRPPTPAPAAPSELEAQLSPGEAGAPRGEEPAPPAAAVSEVQAFARPPAPEGPVASFVAGEAAPAPKSFLELLDASIALGKG